MIRDQASQLREIKYSVNERGEICRQKGFKNPVTYAVTSGKGGVGKTSVSVNLAITCAVLGKKVLLIDSDLNLASIDVLMGISCKKTLSDTILKNKKIHDIIIKTPYLIDLIPGYSGLIKMVNQDDIIKQKILNHLSILERDYDYVFIDTGAGIGNNVLSFLTMAHRSIVVVTPEPASIMDAYAVIKLLTVTGNQTSMNIITNMVSSFEEARDIFNKLKLVIDKFLRVSVNHIGYIPKDKIVGDAIKMQKPFISSYPKSNAALCLKAIGKRLIYNDTRKIEEVNVSLLERMKKSVKELV